MIPKRRKPQPSGLRESQQLRSASHLAWVRGHDCAVLDRMHSVNCSGKIEAAHVRRGTDGCTGVKPGDNWAVPLCSGHHHEQHRVGEVTFGIAYRINLKQIAQELWLKSPHRRKAER